MNSITVIGNLGQHPEIKFFENGNSVAKFTIADRQKKKDLPPIWWLIECWGKSAEFAANYCAKGDKVAVAGSIKQDQWTNKEGVEVTKLVLTANNIEKLSKSENSTTDSTEPSKKETNQKIAAKVKSAPYQDEYDDIPF